MSLKKKFLIFSILIFAIAAVAAQKELGLDTLVLGGRSSTANKQIKFKGYNNSIRLNTTSNKLEFTNDGTSFSEIGSGSGGGGSGNLTSLNLVPNPEFESSVDNWTGSNGTLATNSQSPLFGSQSAQFTATSNQGSVQSSAFDIPPIFQGKKCFANIDYTYTTAPTAPHKLIVKAGASNPTTTIASTDMSTSGNQAKVFFDCPSTGKLRVEIDVENTATSTVIFDNVVISISEKENIDSISFVGGISHTTSEGSCAPTRHLSSDWGSFLGNNNCSGFGSVGSRVTVIGTEGVPKFRIEDLPKGQYFAAINLSFSASADTTSCDFALAVGSSRSGSSSAPSGRNASSFIAPFEITDGGDTTFEVIARRNGSSGSCRLNLNQAFVSPKQSVMIYRSSQSLEASANFETKEAYWNVSVGGANIPLATSTQTTRQRLTNGSLSMVINSASASAQIPCSGANEASGLTCSTGDEAIGIVHEINEPGTYEYCFNIHHQITTQGSTGEGAQVYFRLVEYNLTNSSVLQEGKAPSSSGFKQPAANTNESVLFNGVQICEVFNFDSVGKKNIQLTYTQNISQSPNTNSVNADRLAGATSGRDVNIRVVKIFENKPTDIFADLQKELSNYLYTGEEGNQLRICGFWVQGLTDGVNVQEDYGDCVSNTNEISTPSTGTRRVTMNGGYFQSTNVVCTCNTIKTTAAYCQVSQIATTNAPSLYVEFKTYNVNSTGDYIAANAVNFSAVCIGQANID